jgi:aspartokinase/homoserine dehydrogenase 1
MQIYKFGGAAVGTPDAILTAIDHVRSSQTKLTVVVSAMSGVTDLLIEAAEASLHGQISRAVAAASRFRALHQETIRALFSDSERAGRMEVIVDQAADELEAICRSVGVLRELTTRTRDAVMSRGERVLAPLFAEALADHGVRAQYVDATEIIFADRRLGTVWPDFARCQAGVDARLRPLLAQGVVPVVPGFLGTGVEGELLTLGRGGTDLTASILGRLLGAERVVLWKEVDGLMTADPRLVPSARPLTALHTREAAELAFYGAKVLHPRALFPLADRPIPLFIRNTLDTSAPGTRIAGDVPPGAYPVKALSAVQGQALLSISGKGMLGVPGVAGRTFSALSAAGHSAAMISQASSEASICFVIPDAEASHAARALREVFAAELASGLIDDIRIEPGLALIAVVGLGMRGLPGIAARTFGALARAKVNIVAIAQGSSELNITVAVLDAEVKTALQALHSEYRLDKVHPLGDAGGGEAQIALVGFGQIGRTLVGQVSSQSDYFQRDLGLRIKCVALADRSGPLVMEQGISPNDLSSLSAQKAAGRKLVASGEALSVERMRAALAGELFTLPFAHPILVDLTADETAPLLLDALRHGFHVVLANKRPLTVPQAEYDELFAAAREKRRALRYEATVGAGLPILDTLAKLRDAGDEVRSLLGCFSGTLGYLMTQVEAGTRFSEAVARARALGYTEPDPRDDLLGRDVGRKALILARTLGLRLDLSDVTLTPLFPPELDNPDPDAFVAGLAAIDADFATRAATAEREGKVLRYVVRITRERVTVGLETVEAASPLGRLRGTDNQIALYTRRYENNPLVVTGPGAGAEVTAAGVLNDIVAVAIEAGRS